MMPRKKIIVGISGASGIQVSVSLLMQLRNMENMESHLIISKNAEKTIQAETNYSIEDVKRLADRCYFSDDMAAPAASGTFQTIGMIIVPCSMKTIGGIAGGYSDNLLLRAADVMLKEKRTLILVARECPLNRIHLKNMLEVLDAGAELFPMMMTFYNKPESVEDMIHHLTCKILDRLGLPTENFQRWKGLQ